MKKQITISIEKDLLSWLDKRVDERKFANRSHGFEFLMAKAKERSLERWSDEGTD